MAVARRTEPRRSAAAPEMARLGRLCAERRVALRMTQQTVADLAGISRSSVQALEYGRGSVGLAAVVEVAAVLGRQLGLSAAVDNDADSAVADNDEQ